MEDNKQLTKNVATSTYNSVTIHRILRNGTRDEILEMLQHKPDLNCISEDAHYMGDTVLHASLRNEKLVEKHVIEISTVLLSQGVDPNIVNKNEHTSLHLAVERRLKNVVDLLLKFKANVRAVNEIGNSIAHFFIVDEYEKCKLAMLYPIMNTEENREIQERCSVNFLEFLISKNFDFDLQNKGGTSALYSAIMYQLLHILPTLFEHTQDIEFVGRNNTLLHYFLNERSLKLRDERPHFNYDSKYATKCVSILLDRNIPILECPKYGCTLISTAIKNREEMGIIEALISYYLSNCYNVRIATALHNELTGTCDLWSDSESEYFLVVLSDLETKIADKKYEIQQNRYSSAKNGAKKSPLELSKKSDTQSSIKLTLTENQLHTLAKQRNYEGSKDDLHKHVCDLVTDNDCKVDAKGNRGKSALHVAAYHENARMVWILIQLGADVNTKDDNMKTPLHDATSTNDAVDVIDLLFTNGADVNAVDSVGETPLHLAVSQNNVAIVRSLLEHGASVSYRNKCQQTPLLRVRWTTNETLEIVDLLVSRGADVNAKDQTNETPFYLAICNNSVAVVQLFLQNGASVNSRNSFQMTPLHRAVLSKNVSEEMVKLLLTNGAEVNAKDYRGDTPLHTAIHKKNLPIVLLLIEHGTSMMCENKSGKTSLDLAVIEGAMEIVKFLLANRAKVNAKNRKGEAPLHLTVSKDNLSMVQVLVENGAFVSCSNNHGQTPLHLAVIKGSVEIVELLLVNGAKVNAKNQKGEMPLHLAVSKNDLSMVQVLLENGAFVSCRNNHGQASLHLAAIEEAADIVELLLENGADANAKDDEGNRPLHHVSNQWIQDHSDKRILKMLLEKGAHVGVTNDRGQSTAGSNIRDNHLMGYGGLRVACLEQPGRNWKFENYSEYLREIEKLQSTVVSDRQSLFDFLLMHPTLRCSYIKSKELQKVIGSPRLCELFPIYHCIIVARYNEAVTRKSLEESAQEALYAMIRVQLPDSVDKILAHLENEDLVNIVQAIFDDVHVDVHGENDKWYPLLKKFVQILF